ncbi:MAG: hypothetical protein JWP74_3559 [Marmoricola sp.]|nr:hypothetical protein [Marmoricola sp.]
MEWIRHRPKVAAGLAAVAGVLVVALVWLLVRPTNTPTDPGSESLGAPLPTAPTRSALQDLPTISPSASPTTVSGVTSEFNKALAQYGKGLSGGSSSGTLNMPGLQGGSIYKYLPKHHVVMTVTSQAPIGTIGYVVPTSLDHASGIVKNVQNRWSLGTTAYGQPDYAQLFLQAGARGYPVTCVITVDGHVTERRSTEGPYGQLLCQG